MAHLQRVTGEFLEEVLELGFVGESGFLVGSPARHWVSPGAALRFLEGGGVPNWRSRPLSFAMEGKGREERKQKKWITVKRDKCREKRLIKYVTLTFWI